MSEAVVSELLAFAVEIAEAAAPIALRYFRAPLDVQNKMAGGGFDPVTRADREVETFLRDAIGKRYPTHGIFGEEHGRSAGTDAWEWIIDPIDGTRSYISGSPAWGTLIGVLRDQVPLAGVVHVPFLRETYAGSAAGAWMQREGTRVPLRTRPTATLAEAIICCTHPATFTDERDHRGFRRVADRCRMLRYGGDCYSYCMLALGQVDLIVEGSLQPYDIVPIMPIVVAAGGVTSDARGATAQQGGVIVTAANPALHAQALALMQE
jgi:myo-inositol-1(or 4)-monophosphatase